LAAATALTDTLDAGVAIDQDQDQAGAEKLEAKLDQGLVTPGAKRMAAC
jgi:hypothetical protein